MVEVTKTEEIIDRAGGMERARKAMIDSQLRTSGVNDPLVLSRMAAIPRENYVPEKSRAMAYIDRAVPLGDGAGLPSPVVHGMMLQEVRPGSDDDVLIVSHTGYLEALIAPLAASVKTIKPDQATKKASGKDVYSVLIVDGAVEHLPKQLTKLLADDARIVTGISSRGVTRLAQGRKTGDNISLAPVLDIGIPSFAQFDAKPEWKF